MSLAGQWTLEKRVISTVSAMLVTLLVATMQWSDYDGSMRETFTLFGLSIISGLLVWSILQWTLSSRHRILSVMARNNLVRRKRNTALVVLGLLVGSAIVTSSLVIGDSLDATMEEQFLLPSAIRTITSRATINPRVCRQSGMNPARLTLLRIC